MGILEEILESNKFLSEQINLLSTEVKQLKEQINSSKKNKKLILEFSENETLNISMTAKALAIKQNKIEDIIQKGFLQSTGKKKQIFLAKDILNYLNQEEESKKHDKLCFPERIKKTKRIKKNNIKQNEMDELFLINKHIKKTTY